MSFYFFRPVSTSSCSVVLCFCLLAPSLAFHTFCSFCLVSTCLNFSCAFGFLTRSVAFHALLGVLFRIAFDCRQSKSKSGAEDAEDEDDARLIKRRRTEEPNHSQTEEEQQADKVNLANA